MQVIWEPSTLSVLAVQNNKEVLTGTLQFQHAFAMCHHLVVLSAGEAKDNILRRLSNECGARRRVQFPNRPLGQTTDDYEKQLKVWLCDQAR